MAVKTLKNINPKNKRVIVRVDYNVPLKDGKITNNKRIEASLPTLKYLLDHGAAIILLSHLGRVEKLEDITSNKKSLAPVFAELKRLLPKVNVKFCKSSTGSLVDNAVKELKPGEILLLENTRYNDVDEKGNVTNRESKCDNSLGKYWASLGQVFVNDAFGTAHRKAASNYGIAKNIEESCIGYLIQLELENLDRIVQKPEKPVVAILGGSKVSDKLAIIKNLLKVADKILICGGMANTFLTAKGFNLGNSLVETSMIDTAKEILASDKRKKIVLPVDFLCAKEFKNEPKIKPIERQIGDNFAGLMALDVGTKTIADFQKQLTGAKTIF
jgi:phosphoglycerate kinase